ncbi:hypothetical protein ACFP8W_01145 [Nocardioides hankookensis]|uniref:Uncharacterized protein n=1 Tax=Nocardioides hankookensis TaxID=443157 RepID=A0ABW1LCQ1_9ACTN
MTVAPFGVGQHPDLSEFFIHLTGRPLGDTPPPAAHVGSTAEGRLASILASRRLKASSVYGSPPVVCLCDVTRKAANVLLANGVTNRGPYDPWGLLLSRQGCIDRGLRPVLYLSAAEERQILNRAHTSDLMEWRIVRYDPPWTDWTHEREWRFGFPQGSNDPGVDISDLIHGVIVGQPGWAPGPSGPTPDDPHQPRLGRDVKRYAWNGTQIVDDGNLTL